MSELHEINPDKLDEIDVDLIDAVLKHRDKGLEHPEIVFALSRALMRLASPGLPPTDGNGYFLTVRAPQGECSCDLFIEFGEYPLPPEEPHVTH